MNGFKFCMRLFSIVFVSILLGSCASTKVISSWSLETVPSGTMKKVLVLAVMNNRQNKEVIERTMADELNKVGIIANTATNEFSPKGFSGLTEEQITEKLRGSDYSSVMIISLQDKETEDNYTPGSYYSTPRIVGYSRYYRRYLVVYDQMYTPGYYTVSTNYILEADIYTVNDGDELIYSAQTKSYDPNSVSSLAQSFSKSIIKELQEKSIIVFGK